MSAGYDAIVIGAGHNGLVCATELARAGWSVLLLERNDAVGGALRSGEVTQPGLVHDLYATNLNLFLASPFHAEHAAALGRHGFEPVTCAAPFANVFPDGRALAVWQDADRTLAGLESHDPADAAGWRELDALFEQFAEHLLPLYGLPLRSARSVRALAGSTRRLGVDGLLSLMRVLVQSTADLGDRYLASPEARALVATWGMHLDFAPGTSGGAMFPLLECFADQRFGISIARGGASRLADAMAALARELGVDVRTGTEVTRIVVGAGGAQAVELAGGERFEARRAVVANLAPDVLFGDGGLLSLTGAAGRDARSWRRAPGTVMVHLALDGPPRWAAGEEIGRFAYVHIGPYREDMQRTYDAATQGLLPEEPTLVVGQTSAVDPSRTPDARQLLWVQTRVVPASIRGDAAGEIAATDWGDAGGPFADRVVAKLDRYAPGLAAQVVARAVHTPDDLAASNPNLRGGDQLAGSHHLAQNLLFRPFPGWSRYRTPIERLHMVGAATWPGAGLNALSGWLCANELTARKLRLPFRRGATP